MVPSANIPRSIGTMMPEVYNPAMPLSFLVVAQSMGGGGAERMITILLRHLDRERFRPSLALFAREGAFLEDVPPDVRVYDLGERSPYDVVRTAARLQGVIRTARPAVILSVLKHVNLVTLAVCRVFFREVPVAIGVDTPLSHTLKTGRGRFPKRFLHHRLYPCAHRIIAVSKGVKEDLQARFGIPAERIHVIYNPCEIDQVQRLAREEPDLPIDWSVPTVVAAGRLSAQKGFRCLLQAFAIVAHARPCQLLILGEGEERPALTQLAADLRIADRVLMPGFQPNPFAYMARGHMLVLSSLWEGFGNVIVEAMACGIPTLSTDCPSGPGEIISDGVNGLLVPPADPIALSEAMARLLGDDDLRSRLSQAGRARALEFSPKIIIPQYEAVLAETLGLGPG
jgi:glycosyltransferase involved in cell wall biosynthesis